MVGPAGFEPAWAFSRQLKRLLPSTRLGTRSVNGTLERFELPTLIFTKLRCSSRKDIGTSSRDRHWEPNFRKIVLYPAELKRRVFY